VFQDGTYGQTGGAVGAPAHHLAWLPSRPGTTTSAPAATVNAPATSAQAIAPHEEAEQTGHER
jgi:hypothetical protein